MRLDYDCIRDLLLVLEENLTFDKELRPQSISLADAYDKFLMSNYSLEYIAYTAIKLTEAGFIEASIKKDYTGAIFDIRFHSITIEGHRYLNSVRDDGIWQKTKSSFTKVGGAITLETIIAIANKFIAAQLGL